MEYHTKKKLTVEKRKRRKNKTFQNRRALDTVLLSSTGCLAQSKPFDFYMELLCSFQIDRLCYLWMNYAAFQDSI